MFSTILWGKEDGDMRTRYCGYGVSKVFMEDTRDEYGVELAAYEFRGWS